VSILTDRDVMAAVRAGDIVLEPFDPQCLGTNSYDVHLGPTLKTYHDVYADKSGHELVPLDVSKPRATRSHEIPEGGFVLMPGELYLAATVEYTESHLHVPVLNGKSSLGRLGLMIHVTAGFGDVGFCNHWTLEMVVVKPLRVRPGMAIAQLCWHTALNPPLVPYSSKPDAKYVSRSAQPQASESHRNFHKP